MTVPSPSVPELFSACTQLFGSHVQVSVDFLKYLEPSGIKAAYRERVFESHPDRARLLGISEQELAENFKKINNAYEILNMAIQDKSRLILFNGNNGHNGRHHRPEAEKSHGKRNNSSDNHYSGNIPRRPLRIGQFLFYSGFISWRTLINSIVWQRKNRPLIGHIARSWNLLSNEEILYILKHKSAHEKFGDFAMREGFLTRGNLLALLGKQKILAKPLGAYFVEEGFLTPFELERLLREHHRHNALFGSKGFAGR